METKFNHYRKQFIFPVLILFTVFLMVNSQFDLQDYGVIIPNTQRSKFYWGTYKPNLYFAMKNRRNTSDVFGMMWYSANAEGMIKQGDISKRLRHDCKMEDELNYRWEQHNGCDYGSQVIDDPANELSLKTKFIKTEYNTTDNQNWNAYIKGESNDWNNKTIGIVLYTSMENFEVKDKSYFNMGNNFMQSEMETELEIEIQKSKAKASSYANPLTFKAMEKGKEKYTYTISFGEDTKIVSKSFQKYRKRYNETWRVKRFIQDDIKLEEANFIKENKNFDWVNFRTNKAINAPNIVAIQLIFQSDFEINVNFSQGKDANTPDSQSKLSELFKRKETEFNTKFDEIYWNKVNKEEFSNNFEINNDLRRFAQQALSNVLGGIGYFWGKIKINLEGKLEEGQYHKGFRYAVEEKGLFTATPSRSFFARGFLWDEGFHNIIISQWDMDISIDILDTWLSTMSATGWMAREQIRGPEAEAQVPERFIIQDKLIGNPPTFIFPIENILTYYKLYNEDRNLKNVNSFLKKCFDKLGAWYEWFETYQKSSDRKSYQWAGRNSEHNLASGLDDYPRGMTPNIYEKHLDLALWIAELMKTLRNLSELFDYELVSYFDKAWKKVQTDLGSLYYDEVKGIYNDHLGPQFKLIKGVSKFSRPVPPYLWRGDNRCGKDAPNPLGQPSECNPYSDSPCCSEFGWCGNTPNHCNCEKCKKSVKLEERPEFKLKEKIFNPHIGYVNLLPIAFGALDIKTEKGEKVFRQTLHFLSSPDELYSNYGLRSLSKNDLLYHTGDDYWRGNIWINMNYLVLRGLFKYYKHDTQAYEIYKMIRENLIGNIFKQWKTKEMFYEQYSDRTGEGLKARPFNGWTSLILNIITEKYDF